MSNLEVVKSGGDRLAGEVAKVCEGLQAGTKTTDQARRHLSAALVDYWATAGTEADYLTAVEQALGDLKVSHNNTAGRPND